MAYTQKSDDIKDTMAGVTNKGITISASERKSDENESRKAAEKAFAYKYKVTHEENPAGFEKYYKENKSKF